MLRSGPECTDDMLRQSLTWSLSRIACFDPGTNSTTLSCCVPGRQLEQPSTTPCIPRPTLPSHSTPAPILSLILPHKICFRLVHPRGARQATGTRSPLPSRYPFILPLSPRRCSAPLIHTKTRAAAEIESALPNGVWRRWQPRMR